MPDTAAPRGAEGTLRRALLLAALYLVLHGQALDWGLPSFTGWAPDEILPGDVVRAVEAGFASGWHERYPPLHYYVLAAAEGPVLWLRNVPARNPLPEPVHSEMALVGRLVSLAMGAGVTVLLSLCAAHLYGARAGVLAALLFAGMPTLAFHTRLATLDLPYVFWWALSLWFGLRAFERQGWCEWLGFGLAAGAAVSTKDQAYGLYLLSWPVWIWLLRRRGALGARAVLVPAATALLVLAVVHNLAANVSGFLAHVALLLGPARQPFQAFPRTLPGTLAFLEAILGQVSATLGWPVLCLASLGVLGALATRRPRPEELWLLAGGASYVLTFLMAVYYVYDRFVLPLCFLLALFAAGAWERWACSGRSWRRAPAWVLAAALVSLSVVRALSSGELLAHDSRHAAQAWLRAHTPADARLGFVGARRDLPMEGGLRVRSLPPDEDDLKRLRPVFVVCNLDKVALVRPTDREAPFFGRLAAGRLGYVLAWRWRAPVAWPLSADLAALSGRSNLSWANPEIAIYRRRGAQRQPGRRAARKGRLDDGP